jgi:hypothetical protein
LFWRVDALAWVLAALTRRLDALAWILATLTWRLNALTAGLAALSWRLNALTGVLATLPRWVQGLSGGQGRRLLHLRRWFNDVFPGVPGFFHIFRGSEYRLVKGGIERGNIAWQFRRRRGCVTLFLRLEPEGGQHLAERAI